MDKKLSDVSSDSLSVEYDVELFLYKTKTTTTTKINTMQNNSSIFSYFPPLIQLFHTFNIIIITKISVEH